MSSILSLAQIVVSVVLIISILLQSRGSGLSGAFGGEGTIYRTRRGIERGLFTVTITSGVLFLVLSFLNTFLK